MIERFFQRLVLFIETKRRVIIIVGLILIAVSLFGATQITMATGTETFLSTDSQTYRDYAGFNEHFGSSVIVVMLTGENMDQLLQPANLEAMDKVETQMGSNPGVISAIGPTFLLKQAVAYITGAPALPDDPQMLQMIITEPQSGEIRREFRSVLPDDNHALIPIVLEGMYYTGDEVKELIEETERTVATAGFIGVEPIVTGVPVLMNQIEDSMASSMPPMFIVAIFLMFLILTLIFGVRGFFAWRWLPLGVVGMGIVYTFGATGLLGIPITMVSISAFPILIGLGVDYSIQLHNRYDEETRKGKPLTDAVKYSLARVGPSIGIALVAVCLSFVAMLFSPVPMIQDFGLMLIIGVAACYLVAIFFPLAILHWRDARAGHKASRKATNDKPVKEGDGVVERGLRRLAPWVISNPAIIIPIAIALTVTGLVYDPHIQTETDEANMMSENVPAMKNYHTLKGLMSGETALNAPLNVLVEADDVTDPEVLSWMVKFEDRISTDLAENVCSTNSIADLVLQATGGEPPQSSEQARYCLEELPVPVKRNLVSDDYTAANLVVGILGSTERDEIEEVREVRAQLSDYASDHPDGVSIAVTGSRVIAVDMFDALTSGRIKMTLIGVGSIFLGLLLLFRFSVLKAFMATLPIALIIGWSSGLMYVLGIKYTFLTITLGVLILGIGVEYTVLLMRRYDEERGKGEGPQEAMTTAMVRIGRAIMASGLTTIGGFAALLAATDFIILQDFGIMTVINVFLALVSTLVLLPPLVVWVDSWREKRRLAAASEKSDGIASG
jgi:hydrophobe/amphiphile efflux-3 (HAE3) family protein